MAMTKKKHISLEKTINWLNKTEGRDKLCKIIQYGSKILKDYSERRGNDTLALKFEGLFNGLKNARKIFRLGRSLYQYQTMVGILWEKIPITDKLIQILSRLFYLLYWIFDNISILAIVKLWRLDSAKYVKTAFLLWFLGLVTCLIAALKSLVDSTREIRRMSERTRDRRHSESNLSYKERHLQLVERRKDCILMIVKTVGDMIPSSQGSGIFKKVFGVDASDGLVGVGGFTSAIISTYQLYN